MNYNYEKVKYLHCYEWFTEDGFQVITEYEEDDTVYTTLRKIQDELQVNQSLCLKADLEVKIYVTVRRFKNDRYAQTSELFDSNKDCQRLHIPRGYWCCSSEYRSHNIHNHSDQVGVTKTSNIVSLLALT